LSVADDVGAVGDGEGFAFAVVGEEDGDAAIAETADDVLDAVNGDGVDPGEGFIKEDNSGFAGEGSCDFKSAAFAAGEGAGELGAFFEQAEFCEELAGAIEALFAVESVEFEDGEEVLFDGEFGEDGGVLGQVAESMPSALVHGPVGDIGAIQEDSSLSGCDETAGHAEAGAFSGTVWTEQTDDFALIDGEADTIDGAFARVILNESFAGEQWHGGSRERFGESVRGAEWYGSVEDGVELGKVFLFVARGVVWFPA